MECPICCINKEEKSDIVFLECLHSLCKRCVQKLEKLICPFCRTPIRPEIREVARVRKINPPEHNMLDSPQGNQVSHGSNIYDTPLMVRFRRKKNRRSTYSERIDGNNNTIIIEAPIPSNKRRKKAGKNNFKRGRWATMNYKISSR